ncbi:hypothetical protein C1H46_013782 [Malus baccata]|uniref:Uncharacterized protein n=1 Tax=Malus baccata TaxID=106549 RepID=A0A540MP10_MALBA|nr:hypothetical protein C1H46_013782 [Malus baccata]
MGFMLKFPFCDFGFRNGFSFEISFFFSSFLFLLFVDEIQGRSRDEKKILRGQDGTPIWAMLGCLGLGGDVDL